MQKYTQIQVENIFMNAGCILLSKYYNSSEPVQYKCNCGNISFISLENFITGKRCKKCWNIRKQTAKVLSQEYVFAYFKRHNC